MYLIAIIVGTVALLYGLEVLKGVIIDVTSKKELERFEEDRNVFVTSI